MATKCIVAAGILSFAAPILSWGAGPELVGTYTGSVKLTSYNAGGVKTKSKVNMIVEIAADDLTTLTLGAIVASSSGAIFSTSNGFAIYTASGSYNSVSYQFKNGTVKGIVHGANGVTPETVVYNEGKFKLKKTP
jgi:hypothetical protein